MSLKSNHHTTAINLYKFPEGAVLHPDAVHNAQLLFDAENMLASVKGMLESFDVLMEIVKDKETLQGVISGAFVGEIQRARDIVSKHYKAI